MKQSELEWHCSGTGLGIGEAQFFSLEQWLDAIKCWHNRGGYLIYAKDQGFALLDDPSQEYLENIADKGWYEVVSDEYEGETPLQRKHVAALSQDVRR